MDTYNPTSAAQSLNEDFMPLIYAHYKRIFLSVYKYNENKYYTEKQEAFVFGRSVDFEEVVTNYFNTRQLILTGISQSLANRISKVIEEGRAENLTLRQIAKLVNDKFLPISRSPLLTCF